ncbi:MAG TPA: protein kinase [Kofleriaceae bacterium]|nr:protein kinase [Kofleriaceae bacterium]
MGIPGGHAPTRLGRYELLARLATGGMGEIFLARLEGAAGFEKLFVIKRILPHLADDARFRQMLIGEARLASKLSHANICQVYELGETDGQLYIVMEYLEGITLLPLLRKKSREQGELELGFVGGVIQQVADALHFAHELKERDGEALGIVHRDVTPSNIFLTEAGVVKVLDFGIAKVKDASANTQTGTVKGKYAYMAPEQLRGRSVDRRADVFALGVCIYEMVALRRLFQRKTDYLTFRAVMEQPIADVRRYRPDVPDALVAALARALDRDPSNRFDSARQLGSAVLDALAPFGRTWTQGEISDFVRSQFAEQIEKRSSQVAGAVQRSTSPSSRAAMPLPSFPEEPTDVELDDEDNEFPAVDSTISEAPLELRPTPNPLREKSDFTGHTGQNTPPPFGNETSASGHSLVPLVHNGTGSVVGMQAKPQRSLVWPLLAIAMVGITGGALFLVYKQTQERPPTTVNITQTQVPPDRTSSDAAIPVVTTGGIDAGSGRAVAAPPDPAGSGAKKPGKTGTTQVARTPVSETEALNAAMRPHVPQIQRCATEHGLPPKGAFIEINADASGKVAGVKLTPASVMGTPLGTCIRNVVVQAKFPASEAGLGMKFPLELK